MKPVIFYHASCADGYGAAFAAWKRFGNDAEYVAMQYGTIKSINDIDLLGHIKDRDIYILDFSFPREVMTHLMAEAEHVTWLDHHKTAFEMWAPNIVLSSTTLYTHEDARIFITLDNARSGAMIAWNFFSSQPAPLLIQHIQDYDLWLFKLDCTKAFSKALWSVAPWTFEQWDVIAALNANGYGSMYEAGDALLREHNTQVQRATAHSREIKLNGEAGLCVNAPPNLTSDSGHALAMKSGTFGMVYTIDHELRVKCSLRSTKDYDVSALAKLYGGGGHKNAAGFELTMEQLIEILN